MEDGELLLAGGRGCVGLQHAERYASSLPLDGWVGGDAERGGGATERHRGPVDDGAVAEQPEDTVAVLDDVRWAGVSPGESMVTKWQPNGEKEQMALSSSAEQSIALFFFFK